MTDERPEYLGLHHVLVGVPPDQKEAAQRFYEDVLGFVPITSPLESGGSGTLWWYRCGESELHVALVPDFRAHVRPHVAIRVRDLPALRERLQCHGIETRLNFGYRGSWRVYVVDPWGNRLEFISPLPPGVTPPPGLTGAPGRAGAGRPGGAGSRAGALAESRSRGTGIRRAESRSRGTGIRRAESRSRGT